MHCLTTIYPSSHYIFLFTSFACCISIFGPQLVSTNFLPTFKHPQTVGSIWNSHCIFQALSIPLELHTLNIPALLFCGSNFHLVVARSSFTSTTRIIIEIQISKLSMYKDTNESNRCHSANLWLTPNYAFSTIEEQIYLYRGERKNQEASSGMRGFCRTQERILNL